MWKENIILDKTFEFSLKIIELYKILYDSWEWVISRQLLKSWTSVWANVIESNSWESRKDFIHKMSIALKEANETLYWLLLLEKSDLIVFNSDYYISFIREIIAILTKIIKSSKIW